MDHFESIKAIALQQIAEMEKAAKIASVCLIGLGFSRKEGTVFQLETVAAWAEAECQRIRAVRES